MVALLPRRGGHRAKPEIQGDHEESWRYRYLSLFSLSLSLSLSLSHSHSHSHSHSLSLSLFAQNPYTEPLHQLTFHTLKSFSAKFWFLLNAVSPIFEVSIEPCFRCRRISITDLRHACSTVPHLLIFLTISLCSLVTELKCIYVLFNPSIKFCKSWRLTVSDISAKPYLRLP